MLYIKKILFVILGIMVLFSIKHLNTLDNQSISADKSLNEAKKQNFHFDGPAKFAKIQNYIRTRNSNDTPQYKMGYSLKEYNQSQEKLKYRNSEKLNWVERGPANTGGRTRGLIIDPDDTTHQTIFAGTVGGGIWKTTDGCNTWKNLTPDLPNLATSTLAMSKNNTNVIYAGTGEGFDGLMVSGSGIWKSLDKGETWNVLDTTFLDERFLNVMRLIINPNDENEILACTRGRKDSKSYIMKSIDGGISWEEKYQSQYANVQHLVYTPDNFSIMYATVNGRGVLKSSDTGETWEKVFDVTDKNIYRIEMAISPVNTSVIFLSCESEGDKSELYISRDSLKTAERVIFNGEIQPSWLGGQGWYDNTLAAHPFEENTVWVAGSGAMLDINVGIDKKDIKVLDDAENNTSFLVDVLSITLPMDGDGLASDFVGQLFLNPETTEDDFVEVEVKFGAEIKQMAHLLNFNFGTFALTYDKYVEVPFQAWDKENNRQVAISVVDLNGDGKWTLEDYTGNTSARPDVVLVNMIDYSENPDSLISNSINLVNKAEYYFYKGLNPSYTGSVDSLPEGNLLFKPNFISGLAADFTPVTDGYYQFYGVSPVGSKGVHVDHHNIIFIPIDSTSNKFYVLNANDGGVAFSKDSGKSFRQTGDTFKNYGVGFETSDGYNVSQFYGVDKMNGANRYIGGTQDNGTWVSPENPDSKAKWATAPSGDGFEAAWNYDDSNMILESSQYNNIYKSTDGGETWTSVNLPNDDGPFITRIASSQLDADLVFIGSGEGLIKSTDFGDTWEVKTMPDSWEFNFFGPPTKISLADPNVVWSGSAITQYTRIALSKDKGETWQETSNYDKANLGRITGIATHPNNKNTAYALFSQANGPKILRTTNFGDTWEDISGFVKNNVEKSTNGFSNVATYSLLVMPFDTNIIWAGTEIGLFESLDGGVSWNYADNGLPAVGIWQMKIVNDQIVLATHGRGIWTLETSEIVGTIDIAKSNIKFGVYPNPIQSFSTISFKLDEAQKVEISIYSLSGKLMKNIFNEKVTGEQKVKFDRKGMVTGTYIISLKTKSGVTSRKIIVI